MVSGRNNLQRGGGDAGGGGPGRGGGGGGRRHYQVQCNQLPTQVNRSPVQGNQPPPLRASSGRAGGAWGRSPAPTTPPVQPPLRSHTPPQPEPQPGHLIQVSRACSRTWRASCFSVSFEWRPRLFFSFSYSGGD